MAEIARSHEVNANQVFDWRKQYLEGRLGTDERGCALLPVTVNEPSDSGVVEPAASKSSAPALDLRDTVTTLRKTLSDRALETEHLKLWIAKLQRMQFGRKLEKIDRQIEQLELRLEDLQAADGAATVEAPQKSRSETGMPTGRKPLREHLPREDVVHQPEDACCPQCGGALGDLGGDVSEQLHYVPRHWRVMRHRRLKKAGTCCDCLCRRLHPAGQSIAACRVRGCSRMSWFPNSVTISPLDGDNHVGRCSGEGFGRW